MPHEQNTLALYMDSQISARANCGLVSQNTIGNEPIGSCRTQLKSVAKKTIITKFLPIPIPRAIVWTPGPKYVIAPQPQQKHDWLEFEYVRAPVGFNMVDLPQNYTRNYVNLMGIWI